MLLRTVVDIDDCQDALTMIKNRRVSQLVRRVGAGPINITKGKYLVIKLITVLFISTLIFASGIANADPVVEVWTCTLNEGKTAEDAHAIGKKWTAIARKLTGSDGITSSFVTSVVGDADGFMWVDTYPSLEVWAAAQTAFEDSEEYAAVGAVLNEVETCSGNRLYSRKIVD
jgi:hypothetical protein